MAEAIRTAVHTTIAQILEDWAMMLVEHDPAAPERFDVDDPFYIASIRFKGIVDGRYLLLCQHPFAAQLTASLLGIDGNVTEDQVRDALKEMINVISGNLLTQTYGEDTVFTLTPPETHEATDSDKQLFRSNRVFSYVADSEPLQIIFIVDEHHAR